jgi:hypothetical protein
MVKPLTGPPRHRRRRAAACLAFAVTLGMLAAACSNGPEDKPGHDPAAPVQRAAPRAAPRVLEVRPAPYQLPGPVSGEAAAAVAGRLLVAGGLRPGGRPSADVLAIDPATGRPRRAGTLAQPVHNAAGAVLGGKLAVFGGALRASVATVQLAAAVDRPTAGTAAIVGRLPAPRSAATAVTVGSTTYLVGGGPAGTVLATTGGRHFRVVARLPVPVRFPAAAAAGGRIWVFGGAGKAGPVAAIQQVDLRSGRARVSGRLPRPVQAAAAFTLGGRIFVAGGLVTTPAGRSSVSGSVLSYQPGAAGTVAAGRLPVPVVHAAAVVIGNTAYLAGGTDGSRPVPSVTTFRLVSPSAAIPRSAPWLAPAHGRGHLARGSDPSALPGDILIADHLNNRLLIVDPQGRIRWVFPRRGDLPHGQRFLVPDDAFFSPDGRYIIATEEDNQVISVISIATRRIVYRYGTPGSAGAGPDHASNPDDAMLTPGGDLLFADIRNCRIVTVRLPAHRPLSVIGHTGYGCAHQPPQVFGSPNGAFPLTDGNYLVTEINGDWASEMSLQGHVRWSAHPPGVVYPSDSNEVYPGRYLTADFSSPGQVVEFSATGRRLWRFGGLNHPSLALPLPNGDILVNDDFNDRVIVIDPLTHRIVWQYGHTGRPGSAPGYLNDPDGVDLTPPGSLLITHGPSMGSP